MGKLVEVFGFLIRFGPLIVGWGGLVLKLVRVIETFYSTAPSEQKKAIAMEFVQAALERAGIRNERLLLALGHLVDMLVQLLHARQEFKPPAQGAARAPVDVSAAAVRVASQIDPAVAARLAVKQRQASASDARLDELEAKLKR